MLWPKWLQQGSNAMSKLVTDIVVETLQRAGVKHCYGVVGDILNLTGGSRRELRPREPAPYQRDIRGQSQPCARHPDRKPALLHVHVNPMQLVMPPFVQVESAIWMTPCSARAVLHGRGGDVWEMVKEHFV